ncbi:MAG TPA: kynureninase [Cytophagaceae bacterium]|jgi:kynureninase|nr:kynureninase [Cytophagaceae bacterium]
MSILPASSVFLKKATALDKADVLKDFRACFHHPQGLGKESIYFCGNSLGLMPKGTEDALKQECADWSTWAVEGHWKAKHPWIDYHKPFSKLLAPICGAKTAEVVVMNSLTVNLHLALASFYRPTKKRFVILYEANAFSSDLYALESVVKLHGLTTKKCLYAVDKLDSRSIIQTIAQLKEQLALVLLGGVNYYSGELLDIKKITAATHKAGAIAGFDLAHAIGNVPLRLHDWKVDFAVWCSYKYLNAGPGAAGGLFIHEEHGRNTRLPRLAGWWGHSEKERFAMQPGFKPMQGAEGWQLSNAPVFNMATQRVSLHLFKDAGLKNIYTKGKSMGEFFIECLTALGKSNAKEKRLYSFSIITPLKADRRGCQLSLRIHDKKGKQLFKELEKAGIIGDWREPDVIRLTPVPLYNSYREIFHVAEVLCTKAFLNK